MTLRNSRGKWKRDWNFILKSTKSEIELKKISFLFCGIILLGPNKGKLFLNVDNRIGVFLNYTYVYRKIINDWMDYTLNNREDAKTFNFKSYFVLDS